MRIFESNIRPCGHLQPAKACMFAYLKAEAIITTRIIDDDYPANHIATHAKHRGVRLVMRASLSSSLKHADQFVAGDCHRGKPTNRTSALSTTT